MSFTKSKKYNKSNKSNKSPTSRSQLSDSSSSDELSETEEIIKTKQVDDDVLIVDPVKDDKIQDILNRMKGNSGSSATSGTTTTSSHSSSHNNSHSNSHNSSSSKSKQNKDKNTTIHLDDVEFDKLEENERKALKDLFTGLPDIYKITGTSPDDSQSTINKKCAEKLKMYQPDRHSELVKKLPEEKRAKELKKLDIHFKLLRDAYSILKDPAKRKYYDLQKKTTLSKNFVAQKESFDDFMKLQKSKMSEQSKALAENEHKMAFLAMDQKHGFDRKKFEEGALTKDETDRRYSDIMDGREQDEAEFIPKNKFENRAWTNEDFNKMFIKNRMKEEGKKKTKHGENDKSIVAWDDISAANDFGMGGATDFVSIDHNYEDLYTNLNYKDSSLYASKMDSDTESNYSNNSSESDIDDVDMDELDGYKFNKDSVSSRYDQMLNRRTLEEEVYDNREMHDKEAWKSVLDNPFSISASMGTVMGGQDFSKLDGPKRKTAISREYADVYKSIVYDNDEDVSDSLDTSNTSNTSNTDTVGVNLLSDKKSSKHSKDGKHSKHTKDGKSRHGKHKK